MSSSGDMLVFRTPQVTNDERPGTVYKPDGSIKWGANGDTTKFIKYLVPKSGIQRFQNYVGQLIRLVESDAAPLPCAILMKKGFNLKEFVSRFFLSLAYAGAYYIYPPTTTTPPLAPLIRIADNIEKIEFEGFNAYGGSIGCNSNICRYPSLVKVTITASKNNIMGQKITFVLQSNIRLKN